MKKTINITLANTLFYIEEDAYSKLAQYLDTIKDHFATYADKEEIISDIENRIAEKFLENKHKDKIVTLGDVEDLIISMGTTEDFSSAEGAEPKTAEGLNTEQTDRKLFRNPDDQIIAGVASGLAAYFDTDPTLIRLIFVLIVLFGGAGILIYIILWIVVPEAKTTTEKLQMRGEKITLESVKELAQEKIKEFKSNPKAKAGLRKVLELPFIILGKIVRKVGPILRRFIGGCITIFASFMILGGLFVLTTVVFNISSPYVDFPLMQAGSHLTVYTLIGTTFLLAIIPFIFLLLLGLRILRMTQALRSRSAFGLLGLWLVALMITGSMLIRLAPQYEHVLNATEQNITQEFPLKDFTAIYVSEGNKIILQEGPVFSVQATGTSRGIADMSVTVQDQKLHIGRKNNFRICVFCRRTSPEIVVTMPKVDSIVLADGSRLTAENLTSGELSVQASNGSDVDLTLTSGHIYVEESNASHVELKGQVQIAEFELSNASSLDAFGLNIGTATITAKNASSAKVHVETLLDVDLENGSNVTYEGNPSIKQSLSNGSKLKPKQTIQGKFETQ